MKLMLRYNLMKRTSIAVKQEQNSSFRFYPLMQRGDNLSRHKNQRWGIQKRLEGGRSELYSRACYGYRKNDNGNLEIYEPEAEIVRMVYDLYLSGASVHMLRKQLAAEGIKTTKGKVAWSKLAIERILTNEKYVGNVRIAKPQGNRKGNIAVTGRYLLTNAHTAMIQQDIFADAQAGRKRRSNVVSDELGTHRNAARYSAMRDNDAKEN